MYSYPITKKEKSQMKEQGSEIKQSFSYFSKVPADMFGDVSFRCIAVYGMLYLFIPNWKDKNSKARVSQITLAKRLNCSVDTVKRSVKELAERGWISIEKNGWSYPSTITLHSKKRKTKKR